MSGWLDGIERVPNGHSAGGTYAGGPWRFVLHTVEGDPGTVAGCRAIAAGHESPPHLWYSRKNHWYGQTVPLDRSAFALEHPANTPETNRQHAIQLEIFGFAADAALWDQSWYDGIAYLIRRTISAGFPVRLDHCAPTTGSDGAGLRGSVRMPWESWAEFDGLCGHANVPGNQHWDPGRLDLPRVAKAATPNGNGGEDLTAEEHSWLQNALIQATQANTNAGNALIQATQANTNTQQIESVLADLSKRVDQLEHGK